MSAHGFTKHARYHDDELCMTNRNHLNSRIPTVEKYVFHAGFRICKTCRRVRERVEGMTDG